jgi:hypothetical protein
LRSFNDRARLLSSASIGSSTASCIVKNVSIPCEKRAEGWLGVRRHNRLVRAELEQFPGKNISGGTGKSAREFWPK